MSRPPVHEVDASVQAHVNGAIERHFSSEELPRLREAGIVEPTSIALSVRFSVLEGRVALDGGLTGTVTMTCQRCMQPVTVDMDDEFRLLVWDEEPQSEEEVGGYDPIVADPSRLDLRWLAEEQALLGVPLVAKHAALDCAAQPTSRVEPDAGTAQRPFANLKDLLRK